MNVVAVIGAGRGSGKTTTVESLVRELSARNFRVGTIKQIHEEDFTIDTKGKDTWRHAEAGAKMVICSAPHEISAIKRLKGDEGFKESMHILEKEDLDLVIVEGNPSKDIPKIFAAKGPNNQKTLLQKIGKNIICISALSPEKFSKDEFSVPIFHPLKDIKKMADLLKEYLPHEL